jgi:hypothetical protein
MILTTQDDIRKALTRDYDAIYAADPTVGTQYTVGISLAALQLIDTTTATLSSPYHHPPT